MNLREAFTIIKVLFLVESSYYLVLREMGRHPGALVVHHAVEFEGEDAGLVG